MATKCYPRELVAASKKSGIPVDKLVGPFPSHVRPVRGGLFLRIHAQSGNPNWAFYEPGFGWGMYSGSKRNAQRKSRKISTKHLSWVAVKKGVKL